MALTDEAFAVLLAGVTGELPPRRPPRCRPARVEIVNGYMLLDVPFGTERWPCREYLLTSRSEYNRGREPRCTRLGTVRVASGTQPVMCRQHARRLARMFVPR